MYEVTNRLAAPYSSICYIRCDWSDGSVTRASGVVVGINDVLTALHVVFDGKRGGWASKVTIFPGADTMPVSKPYGEFSDVGSISGRAANWDLNGDDLLTLAESAGDLALIGMKSAIGSITGWLPVAQVPNDVYGVMAGYPSRGTGLMEEAVVARASTNHSVYTTNSALGPGASGGPLLQTINGVQTVTGVLSAGNSNYTYGVYAGLFMQDTWNWLQGALVANDTLLPFVPASTVITAVGVVFTGSTAPDTYTSGVGRDVLRGNAGNDVLDGGAGIDTAVYAGQRADYTLSIASGVFTLADRVPGRDGTDTLRNIERLQFADVSLAFDVAGVAGQAYRLYQAAFDRTPDVAGLGHNMDAVESVGLAQVAGYFIGSPEFNRSYGTLDNLQFVTQLYANVLDRAPDAAGLAHHLDRMKAGASRADLLVVFSESPENQVALVGVMSAGMVYTG